jgi:lysyl-tRNA synthetase class 1
MLLNLVAVANSEEPGVLWGFIRRYAPDVSPQTHPRLDRLVGHAVRYFRDFVRPAKVYRLANEAERQALEDLSEALRPLEGSRDAEALQAVVYEIGRTHFPDTSGKSKSPDGRPGVSRSWFSAIYQILLGQEQGPRFGSFIALYGVAETRALIAKALSGDLLGEHDAFLKSRGVAREPEPA